MADTINEYSNKGRNSNENIFMEVTMVTVFVAIIVFSAIVLLGI